MPPGGQAFGSYALSVFATAIPSSVAQLYATNSAAYASVISSQFAESNEPSWYTRLPENVQTFIGNYSATIAFIPIHTATTTKVVTSTQIVVPPLLPSSGGINTESPTPTPDGGLPTGAKAGIDAGVGVGAVLVMVGVIVFCLRRRKQQKRAPAASSAQPAMAQGPQPPRPDYGGVPGPNAPQDYYSQQPKYNQPHNETGQVQQGQYQSSMSPRP